MTHTYRSTLRYSAYGLDPDTPEADYQIHFVQTRDPAYIPPDSEAWPLYYRAAVDAIQTIPGAYELVRAAVAQLCEKLKGHRALPPHLPVALAWGPRTYQE